MNDGETQVENENVEGDVNVEPEAPAEAPAPAEETSDNAPEGGEESPEE